jgi:YrbI family 3-deoxy-D-manno-octulosonate 8-phosphate phosphatase
LHGTPKEANGRRWGTAPRDLSPSLREKLAGLRMVAFDFDGVMTDNRVYVDETGREMVACSRFEGFGLDRLRALGIELCVISTEKNPVVAMRAAKLKLPVEHGVADKVAMLCDFSARFGVALENAAFVGNDVNDIAALQAVGVPIVVGDAHPGVMAFAAYVTERPGGHGAVREVCDLIADIQEGA